MASSLAEQLQPLFERSRQSRTVAQPVLQSELELGEQDPARAIDVVLRWLQDKCGASLPPAARQLEAFVLSPDQGHAVEVLCGRDPQVWASRIVDPDREVPGRNWIVETAVFRAGPETRVALRLSCSARGELGDFLPAPPRFLRDLAQMAGNGLSDTAIPVQTAADAEYLADWIEDPLRRCPVVVVSSATSAPERRWLIDPGQLGRSMLGLAEVRALSWEAAFALSRRFGKTWSVFQGACRLYRAGFDRSEQTPYDHPLLLGARLETAEGVARGQAWLRREAARISVQRADIYQRLPRFEDLRILLARLETERQLETAAAQDRQPLLERRNPPAWTTEGRSAQAAA